MLCGDLNEKEIQKRGESKKELYVYIQLIHFAIQQKVNNTVKQLYSNKNELKKDI